MNKEEFLELAKVYKPDKKPIEWIREGGNLSKYVQIAVDAIENYVETGDEKYLAIAHNVVENVRLFLSDRDYYNLEERLRKSDLLE